MRTDQFHFDTDGLSSADSHFPCNRPNADKGVAALLVDMIGVTDEHVSRVALSVAIPQDLQDCIDPHVSGTFLHRLARLFGALLICGNHLDDPGPADFVGESQ